MSRFSALAKFQSQGMQEYKAQVKAYKEHLGAHTDTPSPSVPGPSTTTPSSTSLITMSGDETVAAPSLEELQEDIDNDWGYYWSNSPGYDSHIPPTFVCLPSINSSYRGCDSMNPHDPPQVVGTNWASTPISSWLIRMQIDVPSSIPLNPTSKE